VPDGLTDTKSITGGEGPAEAPAEAPKLAEGPAAEDDWNVDATPNGDVSSKAGSYRADREARAAGDSDRLPISNGGNATTSDRGDSIDIESERRAGGGAFEQGGARRISNQLVRDASREPIGGATRRNAKTFEAGAAAILDGGPAPPVDDFDHGI
jgi:hypothetical protein